MTDTNTLTADLISYDTDTWTVLDTSGGRWWPDDEAAAEIAAAADPAEAAVEMCATAPMRGRWHS